MPAPPHDPLRLADEHRPRPRTPVEEPGPSPQQKRVVGVAVLVVVAILLVVWGVLYAFGAGGASAADDDATSAQSILDGQRRINDVRSSVLPGGRAQTGRALGGGDGLGKINLVKTTLTFSSDGPMIVGWVFSGGPGGVEFPNGSLRVSEDVYPLTPHARSAVLVMPGATYASCSIVVDGAVVRRATARGVGQTVECLG